ncbi:MAG: PqqD family protein [Clostridia bacterium]|nr:PqqD family protein [Clostridia bacterium]
MKIKDGFILRDVGDKTFVVATGELSKSFNGMIHLNETGKLIWELLSKETTEEDIVKGIMEKYTDAPIDLVRSDVRTFIEKIKADGVLE